ncbi:MAG: prenyltransferase [Lachnospiraceae bacterium]|nr:prenyltransferase [Lachnospiraceae bacterium]MDD7027733.1 prenyltransferase [Lachnospiraceae bacterium]
MANSDLKTEPKAPAGKITLHIAVDAMTPPAVLLSATAPALLGILLAIEKVGRIPPLLTICLLLIPTLMNAAVNILNDYFDYVSGNDTNENIAYESDAPLAYHQVENPKPALWIGIGIFILAGIMGIYVIAVAGILPAIIGIIGGIIAMTYSGTKVATSHLPIGEPLAGFTMGGLIPLGVYTALTGEIDWMILYKTIPMMLIVSQFMLLNNTCDIERDYSAGRRTLPIVIGQEKSEKLANILSVIWIVQLLHVVITWYFYGVVIILVMLVKIWKSYISIFKTKRTRETKIPATIALVPVAMGIAVAYPLAVAVHLLLS